ncbi:unnamed protein product [Closterium sp. NIES-53]
MWQVDMTWVQSTVRCTLITVRTRYIDFGGGPQQHLGAFLAKLSKSRKVMVDGVDKEGRPRKYSVKLHDEALTGYSKTPDDLQSCLDFCCRHAKSTLSHLQSRLGDLESLNGVMLFMPDTYPDDKERRGEECLEHFETLVDLFHARERADILPGVDKRAAKRELRTFVPVLAGSPRGERTFQCGLAAMLRTKDWERSYPNLVRLWIAVAVLLLSTVECERSFSRQNVIKSWQRTSLCDARLSDLICLSLVEYDMEWGKVVDLWRSSKKRRPYRRREKQRHRPVSAAGRGGNVLEDRQEADTENGSSSSSNNSGFSSSSDDDDEEEG